ncbi:MAG: ribosome-associated protein [Celeribacter sp.]|jgi:ribosome-associated protein
MLSFSQANVGLNRRIIKGSIMTDATPNSSEPTFGGKLMLDFITDQLEAEKAEDIVTIDLESKSSMADYMVVCSGRSARQVGSLAEKLSASLKIEHEIFSRIEGKSAGDWVLLDAGDVIVHIFRPEVREFYQLEKMWLSSDEATALMSARPES